MIPTRSAVDLDRSHRRYGIKSKRFDRVFDDGRSDSPTQIATNINRRDPPRSTTNRPEYPINHLRLNELYSVVADRRRIPPSTNNQRSPWSLNCRLAMKSRRRSTLFPTTTKPPAIDAALALADVNDRGRFIARRSEVVEDFRLPEPSARKLLNEFPFTKAKSSQSINPTHQTGSVDLTKFRTTASLSLAPIRLIG